MFDINHPVVGWAKSKANQTKEPQLIMANIIGGYDIKPSSKVTPYVNNDRVLAEIYPDTHRGNHEYCEA